MSLKLPSHNDRIEDYSGKIVGYITEDLEGNRYSFDFNYKHLATYKAKDGWTYDFFGNRVSKGDMTASFIFRK